MTIVEVCAAFMRHAREYYLDPESTSTSEVANFELAIKHLVKVYGRTPVTEFGLSR